MSSNKVTTKTTTKTTTKVITKAPAVKAPAVKVTKNAIIHININDIN